MGHIFIIFSSYYNSFSHDDERLDNVGYIVGAKVHFYSILSLLFLRKEQHLIKAKPK